MREPGVKRISSALKQLVEMRARKVHDLERAKERAGKFIERVTQLALDPVTLDSAISVHNPSLNPRLIGSVNGWAGRYGKRGALRGTIARILQEQAPAWVPTDLIETMLTAELGIVFEFPSERDRWYRNSFRSGLKALVRDGFAEREPGWTPSSVAVGRWRWKQEKPMTLADLRARTERSVE